MQCCTVLLLQLDNKHPNFKWREGRMGADCFVLKSYPIQGQCLNNFVANFSYRC